MALRRRTFVIGGFNTPFIGKKHPDFVWQKHPDFGKRENPTLEEYITSAVTGALDATGTPAAAVEKAWIGNFVGELFSNQGHLGAAVVGAHPDLMFKPVMRVEGACASGGLAFASAVESIQAGTDITMVVGAEVQTTQSARVGGDYLARASHYARERKLDDFTFPALFARRTKAYKEAYGLTDDDLGHVAVKAYGNANRNPNAHMKAVKMDQATAGSSGEKNPAFLTNAEYAPFMRMSDCSQVSDGAAAIIVVSEDGLKKLGKTEADAIEVTALQVATGNLYQDADLLSLETTRHAAQKAYAQAGITPDQIQLAEVHDCFTITEILMLEAMGLADQGKGAQLFKDGTVGIEGRVPVNTGGGLVGFGHPVGATGVKQVLEVWRQMKGRCGDYQVSNKPAIAVTANMGGDDKTVVFGVYENRT